MVFSKSFPMNVKGRDLPRWLEVEITEKEEEESENKAKKANIGIMRECLDDAYEILQGNNLRNYQTNLVSIAIALFEKRASHSVYWKERKCREKFDKFQK